MQEVRLLTLREVSDYLNVNPATVRSLVRSGQLRDIRVGSGPSLRVNSAPLGPSDSSKLALRISYSCTFRR
jgi:excisionase family DNA binding protein